MEKKEMTFDSVRLQMTTMSNEETHKFFQKSFDDFNSNTQDVKGRSSLLPVQENNSVMSDSQEFVRSFSSSGGWEKSLGSLNTIRKTQNSSFVESRASFPCFASFVGFSGLKLPSISGEIKENENCTIRQVSVTRSVFEYYSSSTSYWSSDEQTYQSTFDVSESESEDDDDIQSVIKSLDTCRVYSESEPKPVDCSLAIEGPPDPFEQRSYKIAYELLTTERSYVTVLNLIDQIFYFRIDQENRAHNMFPQEMVSQMFSNIKSLYKFHNEFLLPQLEQRMQNWANEQKIGDIMKNFAPFLKLYTEYVKNFDNAMNIINVLYAKNRKFAALLDELHRLPECGNLTLTHHMLSPVQRLPRYQLLLNDYLKKLPSDSCDRTDSQKALELVTLAANHSNEAMRKIDKFKKLLEVEESISGVVDLVSPTREVLKHGKVFKISARTGDHQERYLFLLSDILLLCSSRAIANRVISGPPYRLRANFHVDTMQVLEGDNLETANTFYVRDNKKNVEFYTQSKEEKADWIDTLLRAMEELYERKSSLKTVRDEEDSEIGRKAPNFIKVDSILKCMDCGTNFGVIRRKHHCHACGVVVCSKCSNQKIPLLHEDNKSCRVCRHCHEMLSKSVPSSPVDSEKCFNIDSPASAGSPGTRGKGVLEVSANQNCVLNGYMHLKISGKHKSWEKRWFALHSDFVLYSFRTCTDQCAMTATPVPGYKIVKVSELKGEPFSEKEKIFKMFHAKKVYYFQCFSVQETNQWVDALKKAAVAEIYTSEDAVKR
ncbi:FYVE, RhoGEF and PH domain-containing protein 2-like [Lycorma delicatula]|uniref:FYVE, RhoGEF and PH domain-containing protein 2-like n=1 Tax=Lycorma delicatula TaxID=130591 RepID=UPI003F5106B0